jgi:hypothetical protein
VIVRRKIVGGVLAGVAAAGLMLAGSAPAAAHEGSVGKHWHCLWTGKDWVPIASGVSEHAPNEPALHKFHDEVHTGVPGSGGEPLIIRPVLTEGATSCENLPSPAVG